MATAERIPFRGGLTCACVVVSLPRVEEDLQRRSLLSGPLRIFQLGYRTDVSASANTHAGGGCVDLDGTPTDAEIDVWRQWGWTMQARYLTNVKPHCHGWPYRCNHLAPAAQQQEADWDRKDAGLRGAGQVQGRWPILPWYEALEKMSPTTLGVPLMATAERINRPAKITPQSLAEDDKPHHVLINDQGHVSLLAGRSDDVDVTATVEVDQLQAGQSVKVWWRVEWKASGKTDQVKVGKTAVSLLYPGAFTERVGVQVRFADSLPAADTGWTACLRLMYQTDAPSARIVRVEFDGWWMKP